MCMKYIHRAPTNVSKKTEQELQYIKSKEFRVVWSVCPVTSYQLANKIFTIFYIFLVLQTRQFRIFNRLVWPPIVDYTGFSLIIEEFVHNVLTIFTHIWIPLYKFYFVTHTFLLHILKVQCDGDMRWETFYMTCQEDIWYLCIFVRCDTTLRHSVF